jgi:hypothetical protein
MHCTLNESTLIEKISQVLTNGLLSSKKEVAASYGKDLGDDNNNTQTSHHPLINVNSIRFKEKLMVNKKCVHSLGFKVYS